MSTHNDTILLTSTTGAERIYFYQCAFGAPSPKTTQFISQAARPCPDSRRPSLRSSAITQHQALIALL
eukprot:286291-Pleurochrysis_carterae.AAC.3